MVYFKIYHLLFNITQINGQMRDDAIDIICLPNESARNIYHTHAGSQWNKPIGAGAL